MLIKAVLVLLLLTGQVYAAPVSRVKLMADSDIILSEVAAKLVTAQKNYLRVKGRYWQGIALTSGIPADGNELPADFSRKPTDQQESWDSIGLRTDKATLPLRVEVHVYSGPSGDGYVVVGTFDHGGKRYQKALGVGPESRGHGWVEVSDGIR